jgi:hypothetical protein
MARSRKPQSGSLATRKPLQRRSKASGKSTKGLARKASSTVTNNEQIVKLSHERNEALEQQAATK